MRYKLYILIKDTLSCESVLYFRHGNHFKDVNEDDPDVFRFKNLTEVEADVWSIKYRDNGNIYMVPESNEFFNLYTLEKGFFHGYSSDIKIDVHGKIRALVIKYLESLKS